MVTRMRPTWPRRMLLDSLAVASTVGQDQVPRSPNAICRRSAPVPKPLDLAAVFEADALDLRQARDKAKQIHPTDIKAAGNEVEVAVRNYLRRMLPPRYYVTSGHLIDSQRRTSPQLDVIVADNFSLPSLLTTRDGTEYVPATSVLAIGEVKSTYYRSKGYYKKCHEDITFISSHLSRPLLENTAYGGLQSHTTISDMALASSNKYLNHLYCFLLCIDAGDFDFADIQPLLNSTEPCLLPNMGVFLDKGIVMYANTAARGALHIHKYPIEVATADYDWCFVQGVENDDGSRAGAHLATLYSQLIMHLSTSHLRPADAYPYTRDVSMLRKSSLRWAKKI